MNTLKKSITSHLKTAALPVLLALTPLSGFAHNAATGVSTTANINLPNAWTNILSSSVFLTGHNHFCTVVGSADYRHQSGNGTYEFGISRDAGIPAAGVRRSVELNDNPGVNDQNTIEVGSTAFFTVPSGFHTFRLRGRQILGNPILANARSDDASMTINCFERRLTGLFIPPLIPPVIIPPVIELPVEIGPIDPIGPVVNPGS
ncbi:MAG: hypothetical protein V3U88_03985 [Methylococcales bacterium]